MQSTLPIFEQQIRTQPDEIDRLLTSPGTRAQVHAAAEGLHRVRRIWVVGTGSSQHAASLGAAMLQEAGRSAHAVSSMQFVRNAPIVGPHDGVVVVTHSAESSYAMAARALAFSAGLQTFTICRQGTALNDVVETVEREPTQTASVGYTTSLVALAMVAAEMGADSITSDALALVPGSVRNAIEAPGLEDVHVPGRALAFAGSGPAAMTAAEGALKAREASRTLAIGHDAEYLLHGAAAALTADDVLVALLTPDDDGFVGALASAAGAEGLGVVRVLEPSPLPPLLAQISLAVRLQILGLMLAKAKGVDPDVPITGAWAEPSIWAIGAP